MFVGWKSSRIGATNTICTYVVDLDSGEVLESYRVLPQNITHTVKPNKNTGGEVQVDESDFRSEGAAYSYWKRMELISLLGLITSDDEVAETSEWGARSDTPAPTTNSKKGTIF